MRYREERAVLECERAEGGGLPERKERLAHWILPVEILPRVCALSFVARIGRGLELGLV